MDEAQKRAMEKQMDEDIRIAMEMEGAFRRGWHQGFSYTATVIETLWQQGYSLQQVRDMMRRFEDGKVQHWRADHEHYLESHITPSFSVKENLSNSDEGESYDA
jgi:hypothetical protein